MSARAGPKALPELDLMLSLADLLRVPQADTGLPFDISPDGENVAFAWNKTGVWEIYELPIHHALDRWRGPVSARGPGTSASLLCGGTKLAGAKFAPQYSPDGKLLAYALDPDGSESYHIIVHERGTDSHLDLTPDCTYARQPNFAFSPDGRMLAILSDECGQFASYLLSIETGERKLLLDVHRPIWNVKWSPDGRKIAVEAETQASDRGIFIISATSGEWKKVEIDNREINAKHPVWSPDSRFIAFSAESDEWFDIALLEVESNKNTWLTQSAGDDSSPCWSRDGRQIGWVHAEGTATCLMIQERGGPARSYRVAVGLHHHPKFTLDGEVLFLFESPKQPPDLWKLNLGGTFKQLTNSLPEELQDAEFVLPEEVSYDNDGVSVPALLYRANSNRAVIHIHGGPNWHVQFMWDPILTYMASRGWTVLAPNYRGSTGYGRAWQIASRFDMGGVDTRDCAAGARFLLHENLAAPQKVAVTGRSHGGYLTMTCLTQFPGLWCGGSAVVPFMNWFKSHQNSREDLQLWNIENMGDPWENYERWYNTSPYFFLDRVSAPVQLICGGNDPRCPASESLDARDKLIELGKSVELLLYENEGHSFLKIENVIDSETRRVEFLAKLLE